MDALRKGYIEENKTSKFNARLMATLMQVTTVVTLKVVI